MLNALGIGVQCKHFAAFAHQVDQVASVAAPGVEYAHGGRDIAPQDLVEDININLPELFLNAERHAASIESTTVSHAGRLELISSQIAGEPVPQAIKGPNDHEGLTYGLKP